MTTARNIQPNNLPPVQVEILPEGETRGQETLNGPEPVSCKSIIFPAGEGEPYECSASKVEIDAFQKEDGHIDFLRITGHWDPGLSTHWNPSFSLFGVSGERESQTSRILEKTEKK